MIFMNDYKYKVMKKGVFILMILGVLHFTKLNAQNPNREKLDAYKIGFFTKRLNLTTEEAERFWPVYNEYQKEKNTIQQEKISLIRDFNQSESSLTNNQMAEIGDKLIAYIVQESALAVTLHKKLKEVLPPAKVIRFYQAENQYKAQLLNELQNRQQQRPIQRRNF
jgi:hypothetical protein